MFAFDNTYVRLGDRFCARVSPTPVAAPVTIKLNRALAEQLGADAEDPTARVLAHQVLSIHPMMLRMVEIWTEQGEPPAAVRDRALHLINRAFDILTRGLDGQAVEPSSQSD